MPLIRSSPAIDDSDAPTGILTIDKKKACAPTCKAPTMMSVAPPLGSRPASAKPRFWRAISNTKATPGCARPF
jgi:hypothetical protein